MARLSGARKTLGSGIAMYRLVDSDGADEDSTVSALPYIKASTITETTDVEELADEGDGKSYDDGSKTVELELTFLQQDMATKELATKTLRGSYIQIFKEQGVKSINGKYQYVLFPICYVVQDFEDTQPGSEITFKLKVQKVTGDLDVDISVYNDSAFQVTPTGTLSFGTGSSDYQYYQYHEQAT